MPDGRPKCLDPERLNAERLNKMLDDLTQTITALSENVEELGRHL